MKHNSNETPSGDETKGRNPLTRRAFMRRTSVTSAGVVLAMNGLTQTGWASGINGSGSITISKSPPDRIQVDVNVNITSKTSTQHDIGIRVLTKSTKFGTPTEISDDPNWRKTPYVGGGTIFLGPLSPVPTAGHYVTVEVYCDGVVVASHTIQW